MRTRIWLALRIFARRSDVRRISRCPSTVRDPQLQLIAERLALNARDAGITVRVLPPLSRSALRLTRVHLEGTTPSGAYVDVTGQLGFSEHVPAEDIASVFHQEQDLLAKRTVIPLLYLPRALATVLRLHDLNVEADGSVRVADFWLEDSR